MQAAVTRKRRFGPDGQASSSKQVRFETEETDTEDQYLYLNLVNDKLIPPDPLDDEYQPSTVGSLSSQEELEDLTGEILEPVEIDRLVGPGTFSSQLSDDPEGRLVSGDHDISTVIMRHRRERVIHKGCLERDDLLLANFAVSRSLLLKLLPTDTVDQVFPPADFVALEATDVEFVPQLSARVTTGAFDDLFSWISLQPGMMTSFVRRSVTMFFIEAGLWANIDWCQKGKKDNEDTFTNTLLKPLLSSAFGNFPGCTFRWSRDALRSGKSVDPDAPLLLPDYQITLGSHSILLGEFKKAIASRKLMEDDLVKLVFMGKKAVDGLARDGFAAPVVLIHGRGMDVDVYCLSLRAEAIYFLQPLGSFRLISQPKEFPLLLGLGPLISAQRLVKSTFDLLISQKRVTINKEWLRGTFDCKGISIKAC